MELASQLFADVQTYANRPFHLTGTEYDETTLAWFEQCLVDDGATVTRRPWAFPQWTAQWWAELDGEQIDCLPIFYEAAGTFGPDALQIAATPHPGGLLTVKNRRAQPSASGTTLPTMQVAGRYADRTHDVRAHIEQATIGQGWSANLEVGYGCDFRDATVLVTTPLSGWFSCASERGCGVAVARWLCLRLAEQGHRVSLLATSGHELFNLGLEHHLRTNPSDASVIVHVGASVAARHYPHESGQQLSDMVFLTTNRPLSSRALETVGYRSRVGTTDPGGWIGEGTRWCTLDRPLLSVAGMSHWFHTPDDQAAVSTDPSLLAAVAVALLDDVLAFVDH